MQAQIRLSSLLLAALLGIGLVAGMIALSPALTRMYYVQLAALILGGGVLVTLYNRCMAARACRRAAAAALPDAAETAAEEAAAQPAMAVHEARGAHLAYADTQAGTVGHAHTEGTLREGAEALPTDLDALLDIAYEASATAPLRAVAAYRAALARYPDDSYIPYLIIELSTLYKNLGDYGAARELFTHALTLPVIEQNPVMMQEFRRSMRYMDALSLMLALRGTPTLPFGDVPNDLIDAANRQADAETPAALP